LVADAGAFVTVVGAAIEAPAVTASSETDDSKAAAARTQAPERVVLIIGNPQMTKE
jgi:hypothetical protein